MVLGVSPERGWVGREIAPLNINDAGRAKHIAAGSNWNAVKG